MCDVFEIDQRLWSPTPVLSGPRVGAHGDPTLGCTLGPACGRSDGAMPPRSRASVACCSRAGGDRGHWTRWRQLRGRPAARRERNQGRAGESSQGQGTRVGLLHPAPLWPTSCRCQFGQRSRNLSSPRGKFSRQSTPGRALAAGGACLRVSLPIWGSRVQATVCQGTRLFPSGHLL